MVLRGVGGEGRVVLQHEVERAGVRLIFDGFAYTPLRVGRTRIAQYLDFCPDHAKRLRRTPRTALGDPLIVFSQKSMIRVRYSSRFGSKVLIFGE
jgi:hypothetical protein